MFVELFATKVKPRSGSVCCANSNNDFPSSEIWIGYVSAKNTVGWMTFVIRGSRDCNTMAKGLLVVLMLSLEICKVCFALFWLKCTLQMTYV